jgi:hypothetical protein
MTSSEDKTPPEAPGLATRATAPRTDLVPFSNALLYLAFCVLAGTGLALEFRLKYANAALLGIVRRDWVDFHRLVALSFLSLSAVHVWVNWPWLRATLARLRWPTLVVAALGLAVLATFLFAPVF